MNEVTIFKEGPLSTVSLCRVKTSERSAVLDLREASPQPAHAGTTILDVQPPELHNFNLLRSQTVHTTFFYRSQN